MLEIKLTSHCCSVAADFSQIVSYTYRVKLSSVLSSPFLKLLLFKSPLLIQLFSSSVFIYHVHHSTLLSCRDTSSSEPSRVTICSAIHITHQLRFGQPGQRTPDHHEHSPLCGNKLFNCYQPRPVVICAVRLGSPRLEP